MKKIIARKVYDTEKAQCIFEQGVYQRGNYCGSNDLYVTKKGALFVHYSSNGQDLHRGEDIIAMESPNEALEWLSGREVTAKELEQIKPFLELEEA